MNDEQAVGTTDRRSPMRIAVISFFVLLLELALIRLIPSEVRAISYFTNLLLFSAFFGLGLGCILSRHRLPAYVLPVGLFLICIFVKLSDGITIYETGGKVHYWLQQADERLKPFFDMPLYLAAGIAFIVAAIPFVTMGWTLAREMQGHQRLVAYGYDLLGSLLGTVCFAVLSFGGVPPWLLIILTAVVWGSVFHRDGNVRMFHVFAGLIFCLFVIEPDAWRWSPYYFVKYHVDEQVDRADRGKTFVNRITVYVNNSFHQEAINFKTEEPRFKPTAQYMARKFSIPYDLYRKNHDGKTPGKVLILGAGSGNDVNIALINGAADVTAVEIDPQIAHIGEDLNPLHPYQDPRVRLIIDDGRHFLWNATDSYDLIIFGTLDSQTLLAGQSNLRLDNYIYTTESFRDARRLLAPDGLLATYYAVNRDWFYARIYSTVASAFPGRLKMLQLEDGYLFNTIVLAAKEGLPTLVSDPEEEKRFNTVRPCSDDWPYIYLEYPTISPLYLKVLGLIAAMIAMVFVLLTRLEKSSTLHLDYFFLGVGFSLMESAAIVRLALAFGATWVVTAVVFATVLLTVCVANLFADWRRVRIPATLAWGLLVAGLLVNFFFPVRLLLELSFPLRLLGALALIGTPVFFAGLSFSRLFRQEQSVGLPFGMNMIGAMAGGAIEYLSMLLGMRNIWAILVAVYLLAWICNRMKGRAPVAAIPDVAVG